MPLSETLKAVRQTSGLTDRLMDPMRETLKRRQGRVGEILDDFRYDSDRDLWRVSESGSETDLRKMSAGDVFALADKLMLEEDVALLTKAKDDVNSNKK